MIEKPSLEQFRAWAETYGGAIARWPEEARRAAGAVETEEPYRAILARAQRLDAMLDGWTLAAPPEDLRARIVASARPSGGWRRRARLWWSALGIATALAGAAAGSIAAAAVAPGESSANATNTAFGDIGGGEN